MADPFLTLLNDAREEMTGRTRVVFCFDDGFKDSCPKIAAVFEKHGARAVFGVLSDQAVLRRRALGDWDLWNELRDRGHFIHPHGREHCNYAGDKRLPPTKAKKPTNNPLKKPPDVM